VSHDQQAQPHSQLFAKDDDQLCTDEKHCVAACYALVPIQEGLAPTSFVGRVIQALESQPHLQEVTQPDHH
jgi:hypothetical protein